MAPTETVHTIEARTADEVLLEEDEETFEFEGTLPHVITLQLHRTKLRVNSPLHNLIVASRESVTLVFIYVPVALIYQ